MEEREHLVEVLKKVKKALLENKYLEIKRLSDEVIHSSFLHQDPDVVSVAVILYSLSKLIERESYRAFRNWSGFYKSYIKYIEGSIRDLEKNNIDGFRKEINSIVRLIEGLTGKLRVYIGDVFRRAKINKASRIYEHGLSMEKTARILGISLWELAEYSGRTSAGDIDLSVTLPIKHRIKQAEEMFQ